MEETISPTISMYRTVSKKKRPKNSITSRLALSLNQNQELKEGQDFSIEVFETRDFCTALHFGNFEISQKGFQCSSCDPGKNYRVCAECFSKCHQNCKKTNLDIIQDDEPFVCYCGQFLKHMVNPEKREGGRDICKMMLLDVRIQNSRKYYCYEHNMQVCSICYVSCHSQCDNKSIQGAASPKDICHCDNENHTEYNEFTFNISPIEYKKDSNNQNIWPIQIINILFSSKEIYHKMSQFVGKTISEFDSSKINEVEKAFPEVVALFSSTFNSKFKTFYYDNEILEMFPYEKLINFMKNLDTSTSSSILLKFRMMFILLFIHLKRDFQLIKSFTSVDFLSSTILERLHFRKFIFTSSIYTKEIHKKYKIDYKKELRATASEVNPLMKIALREVGDFLEKGMKLNVSFELFQGEFEIGLKFLCFMLKRMLFSKKDLCKLISSLYEFHNKFFLFLGENIKKNLKSVKDIFNCLAEIFYLIGINYNDLVVYEYLLSMPVNEFDPSKIKVGDFIHVKSASGSQLFKMVVRSCMAITEHYKPTDKNEVELPEKVIKLFNETLKLFALADNVYQRQLSEMKRPELLEFYEKCFNSPSSTEHLTILQLPSGVGYMESGNESLLEEAKDGEIDALYLLKLRIEAHLHKYFISSYYENQNTPQKIFDEIKAFTRKITNKMYSKSINGGSPLEGLFKKEIGLDQKKIDFFISKLVRSNARYFSFLFKDDLQFKYDMLIDDLIFSNIDETISKVLVLFSDRDYINMLSFELMDIIFSFMSMFMLTRRGFRYFLTGKNLTRIRKLLNRFSCSGGQKNIKPEMKKTRELNLKYTKRIMEFIYLLVKGISIYGLDIYDHKILLRFKKTLICHIEEYYNTAGTNEENDYKIHITLAMKILYLLAKYYEYEEFEHIKSSLIAIFSNPERNFLSRENFITNFNINFNEEKEKLKRYFLQSRQTIVEQGFFEERDDKGRVVSENEIDEMLEVSPIIFHKAPKSSNVLSIDGEGSEKVNLLIMKENRDEMAIPMKHEIFPNETYCKGSTKTELKEGGDHDHEGKEEWKEVQVDPKKINLKMSFAFFSIICKNTYYTYQENEEFLKKIYEFNDLENYKIILTKETNLSLRHRRVILRFLRTMYFMDRLSQFDITKKKEHFTTNDFIYMTYCNKKINTNTNTNTNTNNDDFPQVELVSNPVDQPDLEKFNSLYEQKHLLQQIELVIELYVQELKNFPKQILGKDIENVESYILEIVLSVKFISDFFYLERKIWSKAVISFYKLAKRFIMKAELFKKVYLEVKHNGRLGDLTYKPPYKNEIIQILETKAFDVSNNNLIYSYISECLSKFFKETKINNAFSLGTYLDAFDNVAESNFTPFALIETKDYEYFYEDDNKEEEEKTKDDPCENKLKKLSKAYTNQFINISSTNFLDVIGGISNGSELVDYRRNIVDYFVTYLNHAKKEDQRYSKFVSVLCIITKMLFYDTDATQTNLEFLLRREYGPFFKNFNKQLQETFVHTLTTSKNIFVHERFLKLTNLTKLIIQFLQLLAEGFNSKFHRKIFGLTDIITFDYDMDNDGCTIEELKLEAANEDNTNLITFYDNIITNLGNTFHLMDLDRQVDSELPFDKLLVITTNLIDFIVEYIESKDSEIDKKILDKLTWLLAKGVFRSFTIQLQTEQINQSKYVIRKKIICYIKNKFAHLLISYMQTGEKYSFLSSIVKEYSPSILFEEILYNFNDLVLELQEKNLVPSNLYSYSPKKFVKSLIEYYIYEEHFRDSLQLTVCLKLYILIKIMEELYQNNSLKTHFEMMSMKIEKATEDRPRVGEKKCRNKKEATHEDSLGLNSPIALMVYQFLEEIVLKVEIKYVDEEEEDEEKREKNKLSFFVRPALTFHLSKQTMSSFHLNVNRQSAFSKLNDLLSYSDYFMFEMVCNSHMVGRERISNFLSNIQYYYLEMFNFLIILVHNILMIIHFYRSPDLSDYIYDVINEADFYTIHPPNFGLAIAQIAFNGCVMFIWMKYKFPLYFQYNLMEVYNKNFLFRKKSDNGKKVITKGVRNFFSSDENASVMSVIRELNSDLSGWQMFIVGLKDTVLLNREINVIVYTTVLLILYLTTRSFMWLALATIFVANISSTLYDIFKAIQMRYHGLITVLLFTYLLVYIFMWITYFFMPDLFEIGDTLDLASKNKFTENFCYSSIQCLLVLIDFGIRSGGGIGDILPMVSYRDNYKFFVQKFFYDMLFHIIIILVLGNIFLGIIVDTFADLRDANQTKDEDMNNVCFICQMTRDKSLRKNIDFDNHVAKTHFTWNYVYFLTYLHIGNPNDFNGMQNYVWDKLGEQDVTWIPIEQTD